MLADGSGNYSSRGSWIPERLLRGQGRVVGDVSIGEISEVFVNRAREAYPSVKMRESSVAMARED
jgi:hypothetical protein